MNFKIGEKVIHLNHGIGDVVDIEDKMVRDRTVSCYVVKTPSLTVWVPIDDGDRHSLRAPTSKREFKNLFSVLQGPVEPLPEDRLERKKKLLELLKSGQLNSICRVVRDLSSFGKERNLSEEDKITLHRAKDSLLAEWVYSLSVPLPQASQKMEELLNS